jgi:[protein-PII] uridylyltransferase
VPTLLEKIEADAAKRLPLPPGHPPSKELARYKGFLKLEKNRLKMLHRAGARGREVCRAQATVFDVLLRYLLDAARRQAPATKSTPPPFALVALGGYGRGELNPCSDIDIMFLHNGNLVANGKPTPYLAAIIDGILYPLWDLGLKLGPTVRSIDDCVRIANSDMQSKTSLIEARLVAGEPALFERMQAVVLAKCVRGYENEYIAARIRDQEARRTKFGNSPFMQEPNIKNGCGGLRDFQNLLWMAFFKYRLRSLGELRARGLISETEQKQLEAAYDFLLWVRNQLHYHTNRAGDVLSKNLQPSIASSLGYTERSPSKRIERFMRDVYKHLRSIYLITRTLERRLALLPQPARLPSLRALLRTGRRRAVQQQLDGFIFVDGEVHASSSHVFRDQPRRLMRVFLYAQQRGLKLHPDLEQLIRHHRSLVNRYFLQDPHVHETFLEILSQRGTVAPILRAMHEADFLGKYLPEFGKLTCLVQHEFYHQYTTDEHTLVCVEKLDKVWAAKTPPFSNYTEMFQRLERPFVLYLALLLHDAGKAYPSDDHSAVSGNLSATVAKRLGLDGATAHALRLIIENHLAMIQISQRRDIDDPAVIRNFANQVQSRENLVMLTLHTFADSQGTSPDLWNGFKDSLLLSLCRRTLASLEGGPEVIRAEEKQRQLLRDDVRGLLPSTISDDQLRAHFDHLPPRYFLIHSARQIAEDLVLTHQFMHLQVDEQDKALEPIVTWHNEPDRAYSSVQICTWDRAGLFSKITGCLTAAGLNILSAQIFTRTDGIILDTFFVTDAKTGLLAGKEERGQFETLLQNALTHPLNLSALIARRPTGTPLYKSVEGERIPTVVKFDNETSDYYTLVEIETEDRIGLLYTISQTLSELHLDIAIAKISTEKGAALDTFYITQADNHKLLSLEHQGIVADRLRSAIAALDSKG